MSYLYRGILIFHKNCIGEQVYSGMSPVLHISLRPEMEPTCLELLVVQVSWVWDKVIRWDCETIEV
jgi:hypothetical protein